MTLIWGQFQKSEAQPSITKISLKIYLSNIFLNSPWANELRTSLANMLPTDALTPWAPFTNMV